MTFRVLTAEFAHETNTFSRLLTGKQAFRHRYVLMGHDAIVARRDANTELAGFLDAGHAHGWHVVLAVGSGFKIQVIMGREIVDNIMIGNPIGNTFKTEAIVEVGVMRRVRSDRYRQTRDNSVYGENLPNEEYIATERIKKAALMQPTIT